MKKTVIAALFALSSALVPLGAQSVAYVPASEALAGTTTKTFTLSVISPTNLAKNSSVPITVASFAVGAPSSVSPTVAATGLSLSPATLTFTGPNQEKSVTVTVSALATGGQYLWLLEAIGWPVAATNPGCMVTLQDYDNATPAVSISAPTPNDILYTSGTSFSLAVPVGFEATEAIPTYPITAVTGTLAGPSAAGNVTFTSAGLNTDDVVGDGTATITKNGAYTITFKATNLAASTTASESFTVEAAPALPPITDSVAWEAPLSAGTTFTGGTTIPVTFDIDSTTTGKPIVDKNIIVSIYPISSAGYPGTATVYSYSATPTYSVSSKDLYQVNWPTAAGTGHFRVDVDLNVNYEAPATGGTTVRLDSLDFYTK